MSALLARALSDVTPHRKAIDAAMLVGFLSALLVRLLSALLGRQLERGVCLGSKSSQ